MKSHGLFEAAPVEADGPPESERLSGHGVVADLPGERARSHGVGACKLGPTAEVLRLAPHEQCGRLEAWVDARTACCAYQYGIELGDVVVDRSTAEHHRLQREKRPKRL